MSFARKSLWVALALAGMAEPLALAQKVETDFNSDYRLAVLKNFAFTSLNPDDPLSTRPEIAQRIRNDLKVELEKIGLREDDMHPDFLISLSASKQTYTSTYSTGASGWTSGSQVWTTDYHVGTLVLDFLDPNTKQPFWRGTATQTVYAGSLQKYVPKGVRKLIDAFQKDGEKQRRKPTGR